jgi:succinate dehydrogenase/fumarate reductase flavoprotein subunit
MWHNVGIYRNETSLKTALQKIDELESAFQDKNKCNSKEEYELKNMLTCAKIITSSALSRKESRGAHYRTDYQKSNDIAVHSSINNKGELNFVK